MLPCLRQLPMYPDILQHPLPKELAAKARRRPRVDILLHRPLPIQLPPIIQQPSQQPRLRLFCLISREPPVRWHISRSAATSHLVSVEKLSTPSDELVPRTSRDSLALPLFLLPVRLKKKTTRFLTTPARHHLCPFLPLNLRYLLQSDQALATCLTAFLRLSLDLFHPLALIRSLQELLEVANISRSLPRLLADLLLHTRLCLPPLLRSPILGRHPSI